MAAHRTRSGRMAEGNSRPGALAVSKQVVGAVWGGVVDPKTSFNRKTDVLAGFIASGLRLAHATVVGKLGPRPKERLVLWDFERCSASRAVREALTTLDLDAEVRPCPMGGTRFRGELEGGKGVPQLRDPNTGQTLKGSQTIVRHLYQHYGVGPGPLLLNREPVRLLTGMPIRFLTRIGGRARPSQAPEKPLELYSFEASPYCRFARAALCELELPYVLHNVGKGSPKREAFVARSGRMRVPWLYDPNTDTALFESQAIETYLQQTYGA
jgi:glutathione S-transferase